MENWGWSLPARDLFWHYWTLFKEQLAAVIPISLLQILVLAIFFQQAPVDAGLQVMGLVLAIFGLMAFLEGLRVVIMPFAEVLGSELPAKVHVCWVLLVAFCLGVLVTYAEPAISALRPLASLVDPAEAPYLYYMMNQQRVGVRAYVRAGVVRGADSDNLHVCAPLPNSVLCIGLGVGCAAIVGTLRFIRDWPLKPLIYITLAPTIATSCYMQWGNKDLAPILGVAWDCGGVTTGPVTVPILLALGIGVMRSQRQKRLATAALEQSVAAGGGQALEGFGIVTLASLFPVLAVTLLGVITSVAHPYDEVLSMAQSHAAQEANPSAIHKSPLKEVIFAIRAIMPLIVALFLLIWLVLRRPLPACSWAVEPRDAGGDGASTAGTDDASVRSGTASMGRQSMGRQSMGRQSMGGNAGGTANNKFSALYRASVAVAAASQLPGDDGTVGDGDSQPGSPEGPGGVDDTAHGAARASTASKGGDSSKALDSDVESCAPGGGGAAAADAQPPAGGWLRRKWSQYCGLLGAIAVCQIGMIMFNIGLTYGFTALGDQTGETLPAAFLKVPYNPKSPYYSYAGGLILVIVSIFFLGILATRAEPALNVLGRTVEKLSGGSFTAAMLIGAVCVGVAVGMVVGSLKILYNLPLIYFLLGKYAVAVALTLVTEDSITAVAWDSAGVTTGPVTVPFVLAIGIGFSKAVESAEGFGLLTIMSVAPIISVLAFSHIRKPAQHARRKLSKAARSMNVTMRRTITGGGGARKLKYSQSTVQAAFAMDAGASTTATPDVSLREGRAFDTAPVTVREEAQRPQHTTQGEA
ncbi:pf07556 family [Micractinium conductrix]|uniref:Pf07556 family n=1 Tax=Micractinium conductrix TaxID=554055 RepID=A0A2P6V6L2_9CHLO|nr:pf07556 family [Micractinium conductrix]|eukprot:PSC69722.1 pf07556 family [Micractinium conductrix]